MNSDPVVLVQSGLSLLRAGRAAAAERCALEALASAPASTEALDLLGIALQAQGRHAEAARRFQALTRQRPEYASGWVNLGTVLRATGRFDEALAAYHRAEALGVRSADFHYNLGLLQVDRGDHEAARAAFAAAHRSSPQDAEIACRLAAACVETLEPAMGLAALRDWPRFPGLDCEHIARIGNLLMNLGDMSGAEAALQRAAADPAADAAALLQLVLGFERGNRLAEARAALERLRRHPQRATLGEELLLAEARVAEREGRHADAAGHYVSLVAGCGDLARAHFHQFPLAKALHALGEHARAWSTLEDAHASQVAWIERTQPEVVERRRETMRVTRFGCDAADHAGWRDEAAPDVAASPVFIVAFPRSGTTLLEQALDAHPRLVSMDEQPFLQQAIAHLEVGDARYPARMAGLSAQQLADARAHYWRLVRQRLVLAPGQRLIDKNPLNLLRLPAIARLFPNAPVVLAIRHPCDVLLSCFMQHFRAEFAWQCRDPDTLALAYDRSFDYWYAQAELLRPSVHEVRYEQLVAEFEPRLRELADFLALDWQPAMLAPAARARARGFISSPSYAQVLEPVHRAAVGRWQAYREHFEPLLPRLQRWLTRWDYGV